MNADRQCPGHGFSLAQPCRGCEHLKRWSDGFAAHGHIQPGPVVDATSCAADGYRHREPPLKPHTARKPKNTHQPTA